MCLSVQMAMNDQLTQFINIMGGSLNRGIGRWLLGGGAYQWL